MTTEINFKVPAKLIFFGEHAVLEGSRGICAAISLRGKGKSVINEGSEKNFEIFFNNKKIGELEEVPPGTRTELFLPFHFGNGLGSSAMISAVIGLLELVKESGRTDKVSLRRKAMEKEKQFCPGISGIDHTTVIQGGLISFSIKDEDPERLSTSLFKENKLIIWNSGIQKNTKVEIENTKKNANRKEIIQKIMVVCERAYEEIVKEDVDLKLIHTLMRENQELLELLGLCPETMKKEILEMRKLGVEAKISGAGNGGYLYSIVPKGFQNREGWIDCEIDYDGVEFTIDEMK